MNLYNINSNKHAPHKSYFPERRMHDLKFYDNKMMKKREEFRMIFISFLLCLCLLNCCFSSRYDESKIFPSQKRHENFSNLNCLNCRGCVMSKEKSKKEIN